MNDAILENGVYDALTARLVSLVEDGIPNELDALSAVRLTLAEAGVFSQRTAELVLAGADV